MIDINELLTKIKELDSKFHMPPILREKVFEKTYSTIVEALVREAEMKSFENEHPAVKDLREQLDEMIKLTKENK